MEEYYPQQISQPVSSDELAAGQFQEDKIKK